MVTPADKNLTTTQLLSLNPDKIAAKIGEASVRQLSDFFRVDGKITAISPPDVDGNTNVDEYAVDIFAGGYNYAKTDTALGIYLNPGETFNIGDNVEVLITIYGYNFLFPYTKSTGLKACTVTFSTGANGTTTTTPAYRYLFGNDVITGKPILNKDGSRPVAQSPVWGRSIGEYNTASNATYYTNPATGNPILYQVDETEQVCT